MTVTRDVADFAARLHGRGGQGVVTAAELLSVAAFLDGFEAQAFPSFGSERMGAPVTSYCRISTRAIRAREPVLRPDAVVVIDSTLLHHVDVFSGLVDDGRVLINSSHSPAALGLGPLLDRLPPGHVVSVPATDLAREHIRRPRPNICLLGALAGMTGQVSLGSLDTAVAERFPAELAAANSAAAHAAFDIARDLCHA